MSHTKTGANRLKGGLEPGWALSHKTGTGQELGGYQAGYNDIGILTAPDGRSYSVAVMIKLTSVPLPTRMTLMNNVVRAIITQHDMQYAAARELSAIRRALPVPCSSGRTCTLLMLVNSRIPKRRAFAAVARMLDPAERHARVGADILVDEAHARLRAPRRRCAGRDQGRQ